MLQRTRDFLHRHPWFAWLALAPIAGIFAFSIGSNQLGNGSAGREDAAVVNGEKIPGSEAAQAWSEMQKRWSQQFGTEVPADQRARMQDNILDNLVMRKVMQQRMQDENFRVSEQRILAEIEKIPAFRNEEGNYDPARARQVLAANGITERELYNQTRSSLLLSQLETGLGNSYFLMPSETRRLFDLENEEREIEYVKFDAAKLAGDATIDEAAIQKYYDENGDRFMTTESVSLEYAELRLEQLATQVAPTEADLRKLYDENHDVYVTDEARRAAHILITVDDGNDAAALKQAQAVLAEARAGKDFGELARKYSKDAGTANAGGELGTVQHRDIPGPAGDAIFSMKVGEIAGPVKAPEGYHIIKLEEITPGGAKPFEEVRAEIDSQYRHDKAADLFGERQDQIAAMLEKGETDIDKLAQALGLTRGSIPQFLRGGGAEPLGSSKDLQDVVFDDSTLNQGKIGGPVALGEDRLVLVKVTGHKKAEVKPLAEVHDQIVELLRHERGIEAAKAAAAELVTKLEGGEKLATLATSLKVSVEPARFIGRVDPSVPAALATAVFEAPRPGDKPVVKSATLDDGSTAVFVLTRTRVSDTSGNPQLVQQQNARLAQRSGNGDIAAYFAEARRKSKVVKNPKVFE